MRTVVVFPAPFGALRRERFELTPDEGQCLSERGEPVRLAILGRRVLSRMSEIK